MLHPSLNFTIYVPDLYSVSIFEKCQQCYSFVIIQYYCPSAGFRWWGPGAQAWWEAPSADAKCLGRGGSMKSLVFPHIITIYDVILWRHIC